MLNYNAYIYRQLNILTHSYTLHAELAYVNVTGEESDLESDNWVDNGQVMKLQV